MTKNTHSLDGKLTSAQVAAQLSVHQNTVNSWAKNGALPVWGRLPGLRGANLFDPADVARLAVRITGEARESDAARRATEKARKAAALTRRAKRRAA
jgi:hypothetical protein